MPVESDADRESFFEEDEFSIRVTTLNGDFTATFDNEFAAAAFGDGARVNDTAPQLTCSTADVERLELDKEGAQLELTFRDQVLKFAVRAHQPDGSGVSTLVLSTVE